MSNNLLNRSNYFSPDFDQSLFFFYPKQFTLTLSLNGIEVMNVAGESAFVPVDSSLKILLTQYSVGNFAEAMPSIKIVNMAQNAATSFAADAIKSYIVFTRDSLNTQFAVANASPIIFIKESSTSFNVEV